MILMFMRYRKLDGIALSLNDPSPVMPTLETSAAEETNWFEEQQVYYRGNVLSLAWSLSI